ncbi:ubl carboxyl-terminal hydrolase 18-like, partial [Solea senegalensis]
MRGLSNHCNYYSVNSVLQCLFGNRELQCLIRQVDRDYRTPGKTIAVMLKRIICEMSNDSELPCDPTSFLHTMSSDSSDMRTMRHYN